MLEKYNDSKISRDVVEYIIKEVMLVDKEDKIKIVVNKGSAVLNENCKELIVNGLKDEYKRSMNRQQDNNIKQLYFFFAGVFLIFLSTLVKEQVILREVILIGGWVPIWEMVRIELIPDAQGRVKRRILRKLMHSEIVEKI